jgi:2-polyprenyl-3-methyl-5-hydroxy-6-metoxy-1,4-benzoquinol methylase
MEHSFFAAEDDKYSALWKDDYRDANWKRLASIVLKKTASYDGHVSLLDFGFGSGRSIDFFESKGFNVCGVEISSYAVGVQLAKGRDIYHASLDDLCMLGDKQFDFGFCNDVLEHIPLHLIGRSLAEMVRVCSDALFLSVCPTPSHHLSKESENLHLTVRPEPWWANEFMKYGPVERFRFLFSRSVRYTINLKHS